jgi:hypothetical protein
LDENHVDIKAVIFDNFKFMFEQSEDEQLPCVMCGQHNEQMLMLGCEHDPCINCASIHYTENQPYNSAVI